MLATYTLLPSGVTASPFVNVMPPMLIDFTITLVCALITTTSVSALTYTRVPFAFTATAVGALLRGMVATTVLVETLITEMLAGVALHTNTLSPIGLTMIPEGFSPT